MTYCPNCGHNLGTGVGGCTTVALPTGGECPDPVRCTWKCTRPPKIGELGAWRCGHGVVVTKHPRGWCDQGCCR